MYLKSFIRKENLCVESDRPLYGFKYHERKTKPQEIRKRQFQVKRLKSQGTYLDLQNQVANS